MPGQPPPLTDGTQLLLAPPHPTLGQAVPVPKGVPWFPDEMMSAWPAWRGGLLDQVQQHPAHRPRLDVRESIDGATMYELMAAAEGWPATDWLTPWEKAS